ncbi:MAG TPA: hypothetical protein VK172_14920 [Lentimicrobium sp.]|nr:hypothetical protein [Bacteroidales bacterium]HLO92455.1 hypothetical protein [Lentimicrobium sp.]
MVKLTVIYIPEKRRLTFFKDGRMMGGLCGQIAEQRFNAIKEQVEASDILKSLIHGTEAKTKKV